MPFTLRSTGRRPLLRAPLLLLLIAACLAGCGYKGPLFMPKAQAQAKKPGPLVTPEPPYERPVPSDAAPLPK
jgi:predicted small lipoprotein YifL